MSIVAQIKPDTELLRGVLNRQAQFRTIKNPNLDDLSKSGLFSYAGRLSRPFGAWHCPSCGMDDANGQDTGAAA